MSPETSAPAGQSFAMDLHRRGSVIDGRLCGEFDLGSAAALRARITTLANGRRREFAFDVSALTFAGADFVNAMNWIRREHGHVSLIDPPPLLTRVCQITGAAEVIVVRHR